MLSIAGETRAAEGLYLTWNDCASGGSASSNRESTCSTTGSQSLYAAFTLDAPLDGVVALEVSIDLQHAGNALPPWWRYAPGECRYGMLMANAGFSGDLGCTDFWMGEAGAVSPPTYYEMLPHGIASQARIVATAGVPSISAKRLDSTSTMYYGIKLVFQNAGTDVCAGCLEGACLVLNSVRIGRILVGGGSETVTLSTAGPANANWATWQGGGGASCMAVPIRAIRWGGVKALYR